MNEATRLEDPYYEDRPARWLRDIIEDYHKISIIIDDDLDQQHVVASEQEQAIWVKPGLPLSTFHSLIGQAVIHIRFGDLAGLNFKPIHRGPWLAASNGLIVPHRH